MARFIIVMGVSGNGKSTLARGIAYAMNWTFAEGDDFHPQTNVDKMAAGIPLTDEDRWPWLRAIGAWIDAERAEGADAVITCSALRRVYRDLLREGRPEVEFCHVDVELAELEARLSGRKGHYMPSSLLPSQLSTLEELQPDEPGTIIPDAGSPERTLMAAIKALRLQPVAPMPPPAGALEAIPAVGPYQRGV